MSDTDPVPASAMTDRLAYEVGEWVGYSGDGGEHEGEIAEIAWSGSHIEHHETGERIPGVVLTIRCYACTERDEPHLFATPVSPAYQWSHLGGES